MSVNAILLGLVLALAVWEVLAGLVVSGPFAPMVSVSEYAWNFQIRYGWPARLAVALALALLALHLLARWPLGPPQ